MFYFSALSSSPLFLTVFLIDYSYCGGVFVAQGTDSLILLLQMLLRFELMLLGFEWYYMARLSFCWLFIVTKLFIIPLSETSLFWPVFILCPEFYY